MSTLEINKIIGAVLAAGIVAMASGFVSELVYEEEALEENVYQVALGADSGAEATPEATPEAGAAEGGRLAPLLAAADPDAGRKVMKKCMACHSLDRGGPNKIGPNLWDIVDRPVAAAEGFSYSGALQEKSGETWSYANLDAFLKKPRAWAPGTKMSFGGIKKAKQRANLIAHLRTLSDSPAALPE